MSERTTMTMEFDCEWCNAGHWEADCYVDFPLSMYFPEFVEEDEALCPSCEHIVHPRRGSDLHAAMASIVEEAEGSR